MATPLTGNNCALLDQPLRHGHSDLLGFCDAGAGGLALRAKKASVGRAPCRLQEQHIHARKQGVRRQRHRAASPKRPADGALCGYL